MMATVSSIIPSHNREDLLIRAVESVLAQSYDDFEVVVVDDHSEIPVVEVLEKAGIDDSRIRVHRHENNKGGNAARNTGIQVANGEYLAFLDDDDEWLPQKLERQISVMEENQADASYTGVNQVRNGSITAVRRPDIAGSITADLLKRPFGGFSSICVSSEVFDTIQGPDQNLPSWQEWDFYIRVSEVADFACVSDPLVNQHIHDGKRITGNYEIKRDVSAPMLRNKHREQAERLGVLDKFEATLAAELGWAAIGSEEYWEARKHFYRSIKFVPNRKRLFMFLLLIGGGWSISIAQKFKRSIPGGFKFKNNR